MADGAKPFIIAPGGGDPFEQLLAQVRQAAEGVYDVLGEMGRSKSGNVVYLAREIETGHLVAMKLSRSGAGAADFDLEVVKTLDTAVPGLESKCPECKEILGDWDRFCFRCGADLSAAEFNPGADEALQMLEAVKEATRGVYEIYGKMERSDGRGVVFFAKDLERDKVVALRLRKDGGPDSDGYSIGETQVFKPLAAELGATQVLSAGMNEPPPPPRPSQPLPGIPPMASPTEAVLAPAATPLSAPASAPSSPRRLPLRLIGGLAGALLLVVVAVVVFSGGDDDPAPGPVPLPPPAPMAAADPDTLTPVDPPGPDTVAPAVTTVPDSGTVVVGVEVPPGGVVTLNGRTVRGTRFRVPAGRHTLAVTAAGYLRVEERVSVRSGGTAVWRPTIARAPERQTVATATPPPPPPPPTCARSFSRGEWESAVTLCRTAADGNDAGAQRMLARMYDDGHGVAQDRAEAAQWYIRAAGSGDREAQERLGYMYRDGVGVRKDEDKSAVFFRQAAEGGRVAAQMELGVALESGRGLREDDAEAVAWYERSSNGGNAVAARRLGRMHERGHGVPKSEAEAARWYRVAGDRGDAEAQYYLGRFYKDGKGVEKSEALALEWFRKAAAQGHRDAQNEVRRLENR